MPKTKTFIDLNVINAVRALLGTEGFRTQLLEDDGLIGTHAINIWATSEDRWPSTTIYPPQHENDSWNWGSNFEFYMPITANASEITKAIVDTKPGWMRD